MERFWKGLKDWLSAYEPGTLAEVRSLVTKGLRRFSQEALRSLTGYKYLMRLWKAAVA
ncbi:MAG: hypothetical protein RML57_10245 [Acidobacteriota bacterium]|nr:hypothetical protein [Acidobacteriota bacterium]